MKLKGMRICSPQVSLAPESNSGGNVYARELLAHLAFRGTGIELILPGGSRCPQNVTYWTVHRTRLPRCFRWYVSNLVFPCYIKRVYDRQRFDLLRAHSVRFTGPACLWARQHFRLPVAVVVHHHHLDPDPLNALIERRVLSRADLIITDSRFSRKQLVDDLGIPLGKIAVAYCGVDSRFAPQPRNETLAARWGLVGKQVLLCLGALKPRKNLGFLLQVFRQIVAGAESEVRLVVAGSGPEESHLRELSRKLGITGHVVFTGYVPEADKVHYYNLADVFVQTSNLEGFGLVTAEAMACAVPVVVTRVGSLPEVVEDGITGYLSAPGSLEEFAMRVAHLLQDGALRSRIGEAARASVLQRFSWQQTACNVDVLYQDLITARNL